MRETPQADLPVHPEGFPNHFYERARLSREPVYKINKEDSVVIIRVFRGGKMAHLGHDHIVVSRDIQGFVLWGGELQQRRADLYIPLNALVVDDATLRDRYAMESSLSATDIKKTRYNMLASIGALRYPFVVVSLTPVSLVQSALVVEASISLNGVTRISTVSVDARLNNTRLRFAGSFSIKQSDYGIEPFSTLGGLLAVEDQLDIRFEIYASSVF
jgi:hypothetical protein